MHSLSISPSRTYVAVCCKSVLNKKKGKYESRGYNLKKFALPEKLFNNRVLENNSESASWYFLNLLDAYSCIEGCMSYEDVSSIEDQEVPEYLLNNLNTVST